MSNIIEPERAPVMPDNEPEASKPDHGGAKAMFFVLGCAALAIVFVVVWRIVFVPVAKPAELMTVGVASVLRTNLFNEVTIPAEFRPYMEVDLHAKVAGYLDKINVDFGDKVKNGQLLATLDVPELHDQLRNAMAQQQKAEADYTNAALLFDRLKTVNQQHPDLVAQQQLDDAQAKESVSKAAIAAAKAEVARYQTLTNYTQITAPFDGVVTKRYVDPGALISSSTGSETQSLPIVRVSDNYHLRLDFPVSVEYVKDIHVGDEVVVRVDSLNRETFKGKIARSTERVNVDTRTMMVEVEVDNPGLRIVPGMYAAAQFKFHEERNVLSVPIQAVSGGSHRMVYVVNEKSEIEPREVKVGIETPDTCEILSGLKEGEMVMIGNRSMVQPGQKVGKKSITYPTILE